MKRILLLFITLIAFYYVKGQTIPNAGFENWSNVYGPSSISQWNTGNSVTKVLAQKITVTKSTDSRSGKYSAKLEGTSGGGFSLPGVVFLGKLDNFLQPKSGIPYTSKPDSFRFSFKCDFLSGDTGHIILGFHNQTVQKTLPKYKGVIAYLDIKLGGKRSNWVDTSVKITFPLDTTYPYSLLKIKPDSIFVEAIVYGNGSMLMIDSFKMVGNSAVQLPNTNFENWDSTATEEANGWYGMNDVATGLGGISDLTKSSSDKHSGNFAMQVKTEAFKDLLGNRDTFGVASTGRINGSLTPSGGFAVTKRPGNLNFYYKYTPAKSGDSPTVAVVFSKGSLNIDTFLTQLPPASVWSNYIFNFPTGTTVPDTINILFFSSIENLNDPYGSRRAVGSTLLVDDLSFGVGTAINETNSEFASINIFPNPSNGLLYLQYYSQVNCEVNFTLHNLLGQEVYQNKASIKAMNNNPISMDVSKLSKGIYFYSVITENEIKTGKLIICN